MVIGNGMLAQAFKQYKDNDDVIIFASGVSNSGEDREDEFKKEIDLLKTYVSLNKKLIYFSTCSIFDNSLCDSKYIKHKINIENLISNECTDYIIFRLPIVIGNSSNKFTFFNFLKESILNNLEIAVYEKATRYIIDVDDLINILPNFIDDKLYTKRSINIAFNNKTDVKCLINICENILGKEVPKRSHPKQGDNYTINNSEFINFVEKFFDYEYVTDYNFIVLKKYLL